MRKSVIILSFTALLIGGCAQSYMKVGYVSDSNPYVQFGKYPSRDIYYDFDVSDSLKELWSAETNGSFSNSSVSVYNNFVFVSDLSGRVTAYNIKTGKKVGEAKSKGVVTSAPYIHRKYLVFVTASPEKDQSVINYWDIGENGLLRETEVKGRVLTEMAVKDSSFVLCTEKGMVYRYDLYGVKLWECKTGSIIHSSPVIGNKNIYFGTDKGEIIAVDFEKGNIVFRKQTGNNFLAGGVVSGNSLFIADDLGVLYSVDITSGTVNWKYKCGSKILMIPAVDGMNVYLGSLTGDYFALNKKDGSLLWKKRLGKLFNASPAAAKNYLLVPDLDKKLYFVDKRNGDVVKTMDFEGRLKLTPVIIDKRIVFLGSDNGVLNAYEFE